MPFVQVNDVKLHYEINGNGLPLLMIAGTGLPGVTWRTGPSAQYAAEGFTVITFDHRGTGGSDKPDVDYSTRMFAADAVGCCRRLTFPRRTSSGIRWAAAWCNGWRSTIPNGFAAW